MKETARFKWQDYLLFVLSFLVSAAIGIYYIVRGRQRKETTINDILLGGRKMHLIPVAVSMVASTVSGIMVLGTPAEVYYFGSVYWLTLFGYPFTVAFTAHIFVPVLHRLQLTSSYQYLELRYNKVVRLMASISFCIQMILYMAVVLYAPAIAVSQVTGLPVWVSIMTSGVICTLYTAIGGMKAVIWTDVFQMTVLLLGLTTVCILGAGQNGGIGKVFDVARDGDKLPYFDFNFDLKIRYSFWSVTVGSFVSGLATFGVSQMTIQRYMSIQKMQHAKIAMYATLPITTLTLSLLCLTGLVVYSHFQRCNPLVDGRVRRSDQIFPLFVMETLTMYPGLPGLFVSCVFSAALSTISSGVNALAAVVLSDLIQPIILIIRKRHLDDEMASRVTISIAILLGIVAMLLAFIAGHLGSTVLETAVTLFNGIGGPIMALFILGILFPCINSWGAAAGFVISLAFSLWVLAGKLLLHSFSVKLLLSTYRCPHHDNGTTAVSTTVSTFNTSLSPAVKDQPDLLDLYRISYLWYGTLVTLISLFVALIVSAITGFNKEKEVDRKLLWNEAKWFYFIDRKNWFTKKSMTEEKISYGMKTSQDKSLTIKKNYNQNVIAEEKGVPDSFLLAGHEPVDVFDDQGFNVSMEGVQL